MILGLDSARFGSVRGSRGKYVINTFITLSRQINTFGRTQYYQHMNVDSTYLSTLKCEKTHDHLSSALQTESTKLQNENCTIHAKWTPVVIFKIFQIKWPKSEEKIHFGGRWVSLSESSPTQNFVLTAWPWPHLCRPAAAASGPYCHLAPPLT